MFVQVLQHSRVFVRTHQLLVLLILKEHIFSLLNPAFKLYDAFCTVHSEAHVRFGNSAIRMVFYVICLLGLPKGTLHIVNPQNLEIYSGVRNRWMNYSKSSAL